MGNRTNNSNFALSEINAENNFFTVLFKFLYLESDAKKKYFKPFFKAKNYLKCNIYDCI